MTTPVIPDEAVEALIAAWNDEGWPWPYMVRTADFTREDIKAGRLREADDEADRHNREFARALLQAAAPLILAANADPAQPVTDVRGNEWIAVTRAGWEAAVAVISAVLYGVVHPMSDSLTQEDAARLVDAFESTVTGPASIEYIASAIGYTKPRVISSAADIRALGEAVRDGDPDQAPDGVPMVMLVEDCDTPSVWTVLGHRCGDPGDPPVVWMRESYGRPAWITHIVTDDGIAGHGPWEIVWSRGVELP